MTPGEILFNDRLEKEKKTYKAPSSYTDLYHKEHGAKNTDDLNIKVKDEQFQKALNIATPRWSRENK